jgi:hypothetical protein
LEIIKEIERLRSEKYKLKDIIYILYWKGYPVSWEKLKKRLSQSYKELMNDLQVVSNISQEPHQKEWLINEWSEESLPKKQPGRPSNESLELQSHRRLKEIEKLKITLPLISEIVRLGVLKNESLKFFLEKQGITHTYPDLDLDKMIYWTNIAMWSSYVEKASEEDFNELSEIIHILKTTIPDMMSSSGNVEMKELYSQFKDMYDNFGLSRLLDSPGLIKLCLFYLLDPVLRQGLNALLSSFEELIGKEVK